MKVTTSKREGAEIKALEGRLADETPAEGDNAGTVADFSQLPLSRYTLTGLDRGRFRKMTQIQRIAIPHALAGRDILGAAKTGSGKTLGTFVCVLMRVRVCVRPHVSTPTPTQPPPPPPPPALLGAPLGAAFPAPGGGGGRPGGAPHPPPPGAGPPDLWGGGAGGAGALRPPAGGGWGGGGGPRGRGAPGWGGGRPPRGPARPPPPPACA